MVLRWMFYGKFIQECVNLMCIYMESCDSGFSSRNLTFLFVKQRVKSHKIIGELFCFVLNQHISPKGSYRLN